MYTRYTIMSQNDVMCGSDFQGEHHERKLSGVSANENGLGNIILPTHHTTHHHTPPHTKHHEHRTSEVAFAVCRVMERFKSATALSRSDASFIRFTPGTPIAYRQRDIKGMFSTSNPMQLHIHNRT